MSFVGGEVGQGTGQQGREGVVGVGGLGFAGAADVQEAGDGQVQVEGQAVGAGGDHGPDGGFAEGPAVLGETAGEVVVAVFGGEVTDQVPPPGGCAVPGQRERSGRGGQVVGPV
ncbi:hypothetical protein [Streptomyces sp. NPDC017095]|uniref:hypothetical protein n=1 Tax=Streptomyces sp. NPDC017095 TaxID=3364977 RepID=UPI0037B955C7